MNNKDNWYNDWFNSPYYHVLYRNRDNREAAEFLEKLIGALHITPDKKIIDIACGKGRHAIYLNKRGMDVTGVDLSPKNIDHAREYENERLHFHVHDMRKVFKKEAFDIALNMFTSFGYFSSEAENKRVIQAANDNLSKEGQFVLDFLNPFRVINNLVPTEQIDIGNIRFTITRKVVDDLIVKEIEIDDQGKKMQFYERVKAIRRVTFETFFSETGFKLENVFGDYRLGEYINTSSERMIFHLIKTTKR
ncbi:MAG: class I SAM-dependent methyltransferase [Cyclobacteriaceae bacterium]|nr:class I SAM-dependent methyltransferase [Cyclobacteriaceae bacterium]